MKILVLTSRYTATRDIIGEDFGRQTRLFSALKKRGHDIDFLCADYRKHEKRDLQLHGINVMIRPFRVFSFFCFCSSLNQLLKKKKYDVLIATSDPLWGVLGSFYAKKNKTPFVFDWHDNYETYAMYKIPFFRYFSETATREANKVTVVSHELKKKLSKIRANGIFVVQNGVDRSLFKPLDKKQSRAELKLPKKAKIIAYAGTIQRMQGVHNLVAAFLKSKKEIKDLKLVIAGRFYAKEKNFINLDQEGIVYMGSLSQNKVVRLINAADVVVVPNPSNEFTKYCFPYKVIEYMACNTPIVATDVGDVGILLKKFKASLCKPDDIQDMYLRIKEQLKAKRIGYRKYIGKNTWESVARDMEKALL